MQRTPLTRSTNKIVAGVVAGLAEHFGHDVTLWRLMVAAGFVLTGIMPGLLLYIIAWIIMPPPTATYTVHE